LRYLKGLGFNQYLRSRDNLDEETVPNPFDYPDFTELLRALQIEFRILAIGKVPESYPYPDRPPVHFRGRIFLAQDEEMNPIAALDSNIVGTVTMTGDGEVRWSFVSLCIST
jgi:hypothetical protein